MSHTVRRQIAVWLFLCAAMVFLTVIVGGATRLTHSGLSIVEWQPLVGTLPPLDQAQWEATFDKYKQTPEFKQVNHQMNLDEFKGIFWWEYWHRVLGRTIGMVFLFPFLWFLMKGGIARPLGWKLAGIFVLGGLQGAMGWYMVKSGLVDDPRVSQYRLTAHLSLAFLIFTSMVWVALDLIRPRQVAPGSSSLNGLRRAGAWLQLLVFYMVATGGFVAGIHAGKAYNTFPLMGEYVVPPDMWLIDPWYLNFFNNIATVQFDHRLGAWLLAFLLPWFWWRLQQSAASSRAKRVGHLLLAVLAAQITLGITTLLLAVPVALGTAHQGGAMVVFGVLLWLNHEIRTQESLQATD
ncbi:heme A synthase [Denitratisoma sp. DHT3]|uniref:COX15/CtaA family protein n=1 Tax=Denitratisoma sp. DHT3 TaxID=1981880 RepID=UPI0011989E52|nr:COX15/CtaA family protein [Denitratisoma sp. DHT3]QDX81221.1 heme A synthase [Denitratisoma sp. DHT3]